MLEWVAQRQARKLGPRTPSKAMAKLVFGTFNVQFFPTRTGFDWLSRDPGAVDAYIADPLCGFDCSGRLWADLLGGVHALEQEEDDKERLPRTLPLLTIAGTRDPVSMGGFGNTQLAERYRAAGNEDVTERKYPGARHELLNETNRDEVSADLIAWVEQRIPK
jgi:alpha-beta hydrolase superfamily lysophospholipase